MLAADVLSNTHRIPVTKIVDNYGPNKIIVDILSISLKPGLHEVTRAVKTTEQSMLIKLILSLE
jgi:hypothetical protein